MNKAIFALIILLACIGFTNAVTCEANQYLENGQSSCTPCPNNRLNEGGENLSLSTCKCPAGSAGPNDGTPCVGCLVNTWAAQGQISCTPCENNRVSPANSVDMTACVCPANKFGSNNNGNETCSDCVAGRTSVQGSTENTACKCVAGSAGPNDNTNCTPCIAGTFAAAGSINCSPCTAGKFSAANADSCTTCGAGSTSVSPFATCTCFDTSPGTEAWDAATNNCICKANFYGDPSTKTAASTDACTACPANTTSTAGSTASTSCISSSSLLSSSTSNAYLFMASSSLLSLIMLL